MSTAVAPPIPGYCVDSGCDCHQPGHEWPDTYIPSREGLPPFCCVRCGRRGPKPVTVVYPPRAITYEEMEARVRATREAHAGTLQEFHRIWYEAGHTWAWTNFLGVGMMKNPFDLWIYQDLITAYRPKTILETGTFAGGSALWFAVLMDALGIDDGRIITVDLDDHRQCQHERITWVAGDSTDPAIAAAMLAEVEHPLLVSLDADHSTAHVRKELELYAPHVRPGEYLVVEDTNIGWTDERGARGGLEDYLRAHPGEWRQDLLCEKYLLSMNPGAWLQRIAECSHG